MPADDMSYLRIRRVPAEGGRTASGIDRLRRDQLQL